MAGIDISWEERQLICTSLRFYADRIVQDSPTSKLRVKQIEELIDRLVKNTVANQIMGEM
jgi:hypothetical protein